MEGGGRLWKVVDFLGKGKLIKKGGMKKLK
jgi:hypothetical protein